MRSNNIVGILVLIGLFVFLALPSELRWLLFFIFCVFIGPLFLVMMVQGGNAFAGRNSAKYGNDVGLFLVFAAGGLILFLAVAVGSCSQESTDNPQPSPTHTNAA